MFPRCLVLPIALGLHVSGAFGSDFGDAATIDPATAEFSTLPLASSLSTLFPPTPTTSISIIGPPSSVEPTASMTSSSVPDNGGAGGGLSTEAHIGLGVGLGIGIIFIV
ncbi:hypothetical protein PG985_010990 [Apiospora marii]|uniref:Uncharacterized protein n=1 Tax=Apiospora marii TaxID=335849 RepID=A0ABR1SSE9_9PEZI